jgi:hypothetical protein
VILHIYVHNTSILYIILMFHSVVSLLYIVVYKDFCLGAGWNPSNFSFNPGANYELVCQDEFKNVGPIHAIINGAPAYAPKNKKLIELHRFNLQCICTKRSVSNCSDERRIHISHVVKS